VLDRLDVDSIRLSVAKEFPSWPSETFDVVSIIDVMHHVPPGLQRTFFTEASKRVAPGGRLVYKDMCRKPAWRALSNRLHDLLKARQWIHYRPIAEVEAWAKQAGLRLTTARDLTALWYGHELRVFERAS
jgi:2-polyprenyl-3-methyl-5-hydroxy-6-metoxy-1,4-benzoquinol methylase